MSAEPIIDSAKWSDILPSTMRLPLIAYQQRHLVQLWLKQLQAYTGLGSPNVAVLGRASAGKSVFVAAMTKVAAEFNFSLPDPSLSVETAVARIGEWAHLMHVIPGQSSRQRTHGLNKALIRNKSISGIIYLADWGFNMPRDLAMRGAYIKHFGYDTVEKIRDLNLTAELRDFEAICNYVRLSFARFERPKWMLIVANKADLYIDKIDEAQAYYSPHMKSAFTAPLHSLLDEVGRDNFTCDAVPVCSWRQPFEWNGVTVSSAITDDKEHRVLMQNAIGRMGGMANHPKA